MNTCSRRGSVAVISPPLRLLEYFLLTGRWPQELKFMSVLTDNPGPKEVRHVPDPGPGPARPGH